MPLLKKIKEDLFWSGFVLHREIKSKLQFIKRALIKPQLPKNPDNKVYINLGCGDIASPEFINVDAYPAPHVHYVCNVTDLSIFPDNYADLVYVCHLLEHIRRNKMRKTLWEWKRVLKPDSILRLSVPDIDALIDIYEACGCDIDSSDHACHRTRGYDSPLRRAAACRVAAASLSRARGDRVGFRGQP